MVLEQLDSHVLTEMNIGPEFILCTHRNTKWITELNVNAKTIILGTGEDLIQKTKCIYHERKNIYKMNLINEKKNDLKRTPVKKKKKTKASHRMGENICNIFIQQRTCIQNK